MFRVAWGLRMKEITAKRLNWASADVEASADAWPSPFTPIFSLVTDVWTLILFPDAQGLLRCFSSRSGMWDPWIHLWLAELVFSSTWWRVVGWILFSPVIPLIPYVFPASTHFSKYKWNYIILKQYACMKCVSSSFLEVNWRLIWCIRTVNSQPHL